MRPPDVQHRFNDPVRAGSVDACTQCAPGVLLVRPARFGTNSETAASNRFQQVVPLSRDISERARSEFDALCAALKQAGVKLCVVDDTAEPPKPDAVFPNNWVSFHRDGTVMLYPMLPANRRTERRIGILEAVESRLKFQRRRLIDLSEHEREGRMLEGTGSLVLDHVRRTAYACRSPRTDESLVREWSALMNYEPLLFEANGSDGTPLYHTNVMLSIGAHFAVVCADAIVEADRERVLQRLHDSEREVIEISMQAMSGFGANILELSGRDETGAEQSVLVLSEQARTALQDPDSLDWDRLSGCVDVVVAVAIPTIESVGGGSARCMLAEVPDTRV